MLGCEQLPSQDLLGRIIAVLPPKKYSQEELTAEAKIFGLEINMTMYIYTWRKEIMMVSKSTE